MCLKIEVEAANIVVVCLHHFGFLREQGAKFGSNCLKVTAKSVRYIDLT